MARLGDVVPLLKTVGTFHFAGRVWRQVCDDHLFTWAAAVAYAWLFALFPFLLFLLALVPHLPSRLRADAQQSVRHSLLRWLPQEAARTIRENIEGNVNSVLHQPRGAVLYGGLLVALWAAGGGMAATMSALDRCYELDRARSFFRRRLIALAMTIAVMILLILVICLLPIGGALRDWMVSQGVIGRRQPVVILFDVLRWALSLLFLFAVLAMVYHFGSSVRRRFNWLTPGAVFSVAVWVLLGFVLRVYMDRFGSRGYERMYGALGGVAILLLLFYIDALVLLIGAEINSEIDFQTLKVSRGTRDFRAAEAALERR